MLREFSDSFTGLMGSNHVLNACGWMLSLIKTKQLFQTEVAVTFIVKLILNLCLVIRFVGQWIDGMKPPLKNCGKYVNKNLKKKIVRHRFYCFFLACWTAN